MPGAGIMVNFTAVEPPLNVNRFSNANHSDVFSWMVTDSRGKTQTFPTFDFKDHPTLEGPHGGRHLSVSADLRRVRADSAEPPETPLHEGRTREQDVARGVRFLAAHGAPARRAADVGALRQLVITLCWAVRLLPVSLDIG